MSRGWSGNIEDLPSPLLNQPVRDLPSWALQDLGMRLGRREGGGKVESWERLAERLGVGEREVDQLWAPVNQLSAPTNQMLAPEDLLLAPENQLSASLNQLSAAPANQILAPANNVSNQILTPANNVSNQILTPANNVSNQMSTPENQLSGPASQLSALKNQITAPVNQLSRALANQSAAPQKSPSIPANQLSAPTNQLSAPGNQPSTPENQLLAPANQISAPANQMLAPEDLLLAPQNQLSASLNQLSAAPANQLLAPANQLSAPATQNTAPANHLKGPVERIMQGRVSGARSEGWPGVAVLQRWVQRPGSTAYVLLHALRQIQREDLLQRMVDTLTGMPPTSEQNAMVLYVSVDEGQGHCRHLHVRTHRKAPLHASLDNVLPSVYWFDITGPRPGLHWCSPSGLLQGVMLTLKQRDSPCQECRNQIYGICPPGGHTSGDGPAHHHTPSGIPCGNLCGTSCWVNPCGEKADVPNIGVEEDSVSGEQKEGVTQQYGNNLNISVTDPKRLNISPSSDSPRSPQSPPVPDKVLASSESCSSFQPLLTGFSSFSSLSSGLIEDQAEFSGIKVSTNIQPPVDSMGTSDTYVKATQISSLTDAKQRTTEDGDSSPGEDSPNTQPPVDSMATSDTYVKATQISSLTDAKQRTTEDGDSSPGEDNIKKIQTLDACESARKHPGVTGEKDAQTSDRDECSPRVTTCYMYPDYVTSESVNQYDMEFRDIAHDVSFHKAAQDEQLTAETEGRKDVPVPTGKAQTEGSMEKPNERSPVTKSILHPEYIPPDNIKQLCQSDDTQHNAGECPMILTKFHNFRGRRTQTQEHTSITVVDSARRKVNRQLVSHHKHVSLSANTNNQPPASAVCSTLSRGCAVHSWARSLGAPQSRRHTASSDFSSTCLAQSASSVTQPDACVASGASFPRRRVQSANSPPIQRESCENTAQSEVSFVSNAPFTGSTVRHANSVPKQTSASGGTVPSAASYVDQKSYSGGTVQPGTSRMKSFAGGSVQTAVIPMKRASSTGCIGVCSPTCISQGSTRRQSVQRAMDVRETSARRCHVEYPVPVSQARRSPSSSRNTAAPGGSRVSSDCTDQPESALQRTTSAPGLGGKEPMKTSHHGDQKRLKTPTACLPLEMETSVDVRHSSQQPGPDTKECSPKPKPCSYTYNITPNY